MTALLSWLRHLWMAMGLRGRLVAGYTALFAILLVGIALGETTVVRQVLIEDRKAALRAGTSDFVSILKRPVGPVVGKQPGFGGSLQVVSGDTALVLALFAPDGSVLYQQAGAGMGNVDPRQLLDTHQITGDPG